MDSLRSHYNVWLIATSECFSSSNSIECILTNFRCLAVLIWDPQCKWNGLNWEKYYNVKYLLPILFSEISVIEVIGRHIYVSTALLKESFPLDSLRSAITKTYFCKTRPLVLFFQNTTFPMASSSCIQRLLLPILPSSHSFSSSSAIIKYTVVRCFRSSSLKNRYTTEKREMER